MKPQNLINRRVFSRFRKYFTSEKFQKLKKAGKMFSGFFGEKMIFDENSKLLAKFETISFDENTRKWRALDIPFHKCPPQMSAEHCFCRAGALAPSSGEQARFLKNKKESA